MNIDLQRVAKLLRSQTNLQPVMYDGWRTCSGCKPVITVGYRTKPCLAHWGGQWYVSLCQLHSGCNWCIMRINIISSSQLTTLQAYKSCKQRYDSCPDVYLYYLLFAQLRSTKYNVRLKNCFCYTARQVIRYMLTLFSQVTYVNNLPTSLLSKQTCLPLYLSTRRIVATLATIRRRRVCQKLKLNGRECRSYAVGTTAFMDPSGTYFPAPISVSAYKEVYYFVPKHNVLGATT